MGRELIYWTGLSHVWVDRRLCFHVQASWERTRRRTSRIELRILLRLLMEGLNTWYALLFSSHLSLLNPLTTLVLPCLSTIVVTRVLSSLPTCRDTDNFLSLSVPWNVKSQSCSLHGCMIVSRSGSEATMSTLTRYIFLTPSFSLYLLFPPTAPPHLTVLTLY